MRKAAKQGKLKQPLAVFAHDPRIYSELKFALESPSIYDEFLRHLARRGLAVPVTSVDRDWSQPHAKDDALVAVFREIYEEPNRHWDAYEMCEKLVDIEEYFQLWRFRHLKTVERIIGFRPGRRGECTMQRNRALSHDERAIHSPRAAAERSW